MASLRLRRAAGYLMPNFFAANSDLPSMIRAC